MDPDGDEEDGDEAEVDDAMDNDGSSTCVHATEFNHLVVSGDGEQKTRAQQDEQHNSYHHRSPVSHTELQIVVYWVDKIDRDHKRKMRLRI